VNLQSIYMASLVSQESSQEKSTKNGQESALGAGLEGILGKDAFLRLLTTQLRYQNPLDPVSDQDFLAQMAQFSALEQMQNLTSAMERFMEKDHKESQWAQAALMLGRRVEVVGASAETYTGYVDAIRMVDGVPKLVVHGTLFNVGDVVHVLSSASGTE